MFCRCKGGSAKRHRNVLARPKISWRVFDFPFSFQLYHNMVVSQRASSKIISLSIFGVANLCLGRVQEDWVFTLVPCRCFGLWLMILANSGAIRWLLFMMFRHAPLAMYILSWSLRSVPSLHCMSTLASLYPGSCPVLDQCCTKAFESLDHLKSALWLLNRTFRPLWVSP